jgi:hypothetical protein
MDGTTVWILISVGLVVGVAMTAALVVASRQRAGQRASAESAGTGEMSPEQWISLGTVFAGAGVALTLTIGSAMLGMVALGLVYLIIGIMKKRNAAAGR